VSGVWQGYIESYMLPDGSDTLTMTLAAQSDGSVTGTVVVGSASSPPPPTNPDVGYPPSINWSMPGPSSAFPGEGFVYTLVNGTFDGTRFRGGVVLRELWKAWCGLQQHIYGVQPDGGAPYACLPNLGCGEGNNGQCFLSSPTGMTPVDCGKMALCHPCGGSFIQGAGPFGVCDCTATACTIDLTQPDLSFDAQVVGGHLDGSTSGFIDNHNIHLTHQP
jgi:hypothetical protein